MGFILPLSVLVEFILITVTEVFFVVYMMHTFAYTKCPHFK